MASLLLVGFTQTAAATDWKGYAGANCMQASEGFNDFRRTSYGYINDSANAAMVICPVVRDISKGGEDQVKRIRVTLTSYGNGYCRIYSRTRQGDHFATYFKNFGKGTKFDLNFDDLDSADWGSYSISCHIPGVNRTNRSYIHSYAVDEAG